MENITSFEPQQLKTALNRYSTFLAEVRKRLIFTLCVFASATFAGFFYYEKIIKFLIDILSLKGLNIVFTSPFQFINLAIATGIACGLVVSFPLLIAQILFFLKPALRKKEFKMVLKLIAPSVILFLTGLAFGFFIMKWQIAIFLEKSVSLGIGNILDISRLLTTVLMVSVLMGIGFQFPIVLILLLHFGVINRHQLVKSRMWVYLGSFIFAILLPADSILADVLLSLPIITLYEIILVVNRMKKEKSIE